MRPACFTLIILASVTYCQSLCKNSQGTVRFSSSNSCPGGFSHVNNSIRTSYIKNGSITNPKLKIDPSQRLPFRFYAGRSSGNVPTDGLAKYFYPSGRSSAATIASDADHPNFGQCKSFFVKFTLDQAAGMFDSWSMYLRSKSGSALSSTASCSIAF
ncbi:MAG: hypothetical protein NZT61_03870 [Deltaproteobacteria bacterium]|nr:hypothetical protein [Deltaproteobacteria bacterium]